MNSTTDRPWKITPRTVSENWTASSLCDLMNSWTAPSGSLKSSITSAGHRGRVPNVSLIEVDAVGDVPVRSSSSRSATCEPTSVPTATTNVRKNATTPMRISDVARPRRQPRPASRLTPGSMARARNNAIAKDTKRPLSLLQKNRTAIAPRNPLQKTMTAGTTQPGRRRSSDDVTTSASSSTAADREEGDWSWPFRPWTSWPR